MIIMMINKNLNETDDSIVPFDSNVIFVGLLLVSVYFYFTFFGIVCRNFIYEGTLIGTKNIDTLSLLNLAVLINDYFMPLYLHNIQILSIFVGYETNISILENGFLKCCSCCCCKKSLEKTEVHLGINDYSRYIKYSPVFFLLSINRKNNNNNTEVSSEQEIEYDD